MREAKELEKKQQELERIQNEMLYRAPVKQ